MLGSMIGVKEIAKLAGTSPATVSNVLNEKSNVSKAMREKVLSICRENGYNQSKNGRLAKKGKTRTLLFTFSDFDRSFYLEVIHGIHDYAYAHDYELLICTGRVCEKYMEPSMTSGCIALDGKLPSQILERKANETYPVVVLDRTSASPYIKSILVNNYDSMYELVNTLAKRGLKTFSFLGGIEGSEDNKERFQAFIDALKDNGITFTRDGYIAGDWHENSGIRAAQILLLTENPPDVLVCANDNMAMGAIKTFNQNELIVGKDISVTGFDNNLIAEYNDITTIDIPDYERGYLAAQALVGNIEGAMNRDTFRIKAKLIWRGSTTKR
ncbi:MAG: LacI family transcriptional regulator [Spirochaetia bacterium]|jgi:LacI family transcriptional regulator|nr:LacI family transcriptional regulator [Spirochaetia bacterium]